MEEDTAAEAPKVFDLFQNVPNPFNPSTTIRYILHEPGDVSLRVYDLTGREVTTLADEYRTAGSHEVLWNGTDAGGNRVSSGIYFYTLLVGDKAETMRMTLVR